MKANGHETGFETTALADLAAHDRSPPQLRWAACYAVGQYASETLLKCLHGGMSMRDILAIMRRQDVALTAESYGPSHPEARRD